MRIRGGWFKHGALLAGASVLAILWRSRFLRGIACAWSNCLRIHKLAGGLDRGALAVSAFYKAQHAGERPAEHDVPWQNTPTPYAAS